jgi:hypothetical protein
VTMPHDGAITFGDLTGRLGDDLHRRKNAD